MLRGVWRKKGRKNKQRTNSAPMMADGQIRHTLGHRSACHGLPPCSHGAMRLVIQDHWAPKLPLPQKERREQSVLNVTCEWQILPSLFLVFRWQNTWIERLQYFPQYFAPKHHNWFQQMGAQQESQIYWTRVKWKGSFPPRDSFTSLLP